MLLRVLLLFCCHHESSALGYSTAVLEYVWSSYRLNTVRKNGGIGARRTRAIQSSSTIPFGHIRWSQRKVTPGTGGTAWNPRNDWTMVGFSEFQTNVRSNHSSRRPARVRIAWRLVVPNQFCCSRPAKPTLPTAAIWDLFVTDLRDYMSRIACLSLVVCLTNF